MNAFFACIGLIIRVCSWLRWFHHKTFPRHVELALTAPMLLVLGLLMIADDEAWRTVAEIGQWALVGSMAFAIWLVVREARKEAAG